MNQNEIMNNYQLKVKLASVIVIAFQLLMLSAELLYQYVIVPFYGYHYWVSRLIFSIIFTLFIVFLLKSFDIKLKNRIDKPKGKEVGLVAIIAIFSIVTFLIFVFPVVYINSVFSLQGNVHLSGNNYTYHQNLQYVIFGCVIAPILEEIFWRELLLSRLIQNYNPTKVILILSFVFGVLHFKSSFLGLILLSIIASYIYIKSNSLVLAIVYHSLWNFFDLFFSFFREQLCDVLISLWYIPIFFIGAVSIWQLLMKFATFQEGNKNFNISKKDISH